ncbi:MAG: hypothetical protein HYS61_03190 [Acidobacteria bacterium]|nr:hypothetical protein [Acidobacteriota bacterium]
MLAWTLDEMSRSDAEVLIAYFRLVSEGNATPYLSRIMAPVLGLYPRGSVIVTEQHLDLLCAKVRNLWLVHIPSSSQALHVSAPATCALEVLHFISQFDGIPCREQ